MAVGGGEMGNVDPGQGIVGEQQYDIAEGGAL